MSSFKRKSSTNSELSYPGTRTAPGNISTAITSTGIPSLDDILGGGLPLSCLLLLLAPDHHSSYGDLVQRYFVAEGLSGGHRVIVVHPNPKEFMADVMWHPKSSSSTTDLEARDTKHEASEQKIKIAWRYESMKPFQTTVVSPSSSTGDYCHAFDLSNRIPEAVVHVAINSKQLTYVGIDADGLDQISIVDMLARLSSLIESSTPKSLLRISIPSLAAPEWGDLSNLQILWFLYSLRSLLRKHPYVCASISLAPQSSTDSWGGQGWLQKLGWASDAALSMVAFSANPSLSSIFPSHHGMVHIHSLPSPHTLSVPSDRFSTLRGLSSSGENNLAFKCTRKRLIFETLHLDLEGGVSERRTAPVTDNIDLNAFAGETGNLHQHLHQTQSLDTTAVASVDVQLEEDEAASKNIPIPVALEEVRQAKPKKKKTVAFQSDRPELYDF
ncbi:Elongator complex protein 4 [Crucibulum laeve]|uniref:Elongator complex protein 4 n=1 Tax=Crucibulum laeve TaxID=68775 RepID=A0A5C3M969_9AGAR|nr:Elongator complex protein 4 [Crucibulum laeve]